MSRAIEIMEKIETAQEYILSGRIDNDGAAKAWEALADVYAYFGELLPRLMTLAEVRKIAIANSADWDNHQLVWLEEVNYPLHIAECRFQGSLYYDYYNDPEWRTEMAYIGTDLSEYFLPEDYGKKWRCWTYKPEEAQRKAVAWDA